jgi:apolipoprotein N-acyltransferase
LNDAHPFAAGRLAGIALSTAFPPVGLFLVLPFAVAAFFLLTQGLPARKSWVPGWRSASASPTR